MGTFILNSLFFNFIGRRPKLNRIDTLVAWGSFLSFLALELNINNMFCIISNTSATPCLALGAQITPPIIFDFSVFFLIIAPAGGSNPAGL